MTSALQYRNIAEMSNCCTTNIVIFGYCDLILRCRTEPKAENTTEVLSQPGLLTTQCKRCVAVRRARMGVALLGKIGKP